MFCFVVVGAFRLLEVSLCGVMFGGLWCVRRDLLFMLICCRVGLCCVL